MKRMHWLALALLFGGDALAGGALGTSAGNVAAGGTTGVTYVPAVGGQYAVSLDASHSGLSASNIPAPIAGATGTFSLWYRSSSNAGSFINIARYGTGGGFGYRQLYVDSSNTFGLYLGSNVNSSTASVRDGLWHNFVAVMTSIGGSNVAVSLYVDGVLAGTVGSMGDSSLAGPMQFNQGAGTEELRDVRVYNTALTATDASNMYSAGAYGLGGPAPTVAWYKMLEGSGTTVADSVSAIDVTLTSGTTWSSTGTTAYVNIAGDLQVNGRIRGVTATAASANNLTLGAYYVTVVTGTTQVNLIDSTGWTTGSTALLLFNGALSVRHNQTANVTYRPILLSGSANLSATANTVLGLLYDGTNWQETFRKVP